MNERRNERAGRRSGLLIALSLLMAAIMVLVGGMLGGLYGDSPLAYAETAAEATEPASDPSPAIYVAQKNANSVVGILTNTEVWDRTTNEVTAQTLAQGSGVVIAEGGYVVTNHHVIEDGTAYQVLMPSGDKVDAELVGYDSSTDLAVLKVDDEYADQLTPVSVGSIDDLQVGATVVAIGNPGGEVLANTVTQGVVSALERNNVHASNTSRRINYIQHDAAINSGNSGGGLFNYKGELIGINTLKYGGSAYSTVTFEGLGFAIPVDTVVDIATQLIENGVVARPGLGITASDWVGPDEPLANDPPASVVVRTVNEGGAAEAAGIEQYDFIYEVDGQRVTSMLDLTSILDDHEIGDTVSITVVRYNDVGMYQSMGNSIFGYGYGYGSNNTSGELMAGGGYDEITVDVTLESIEAN